MFFKLNHPIDSYSKALKYIANIGWEQLGYIFFLPKGKNPMLFRNCIITRQEEDI